MAVLEAEERAEAGWVGVMEEAEKVEGEKAEVEKVVEGMVEARAVEREAVMVAAVWEVARAEKVVEAMVEARAVEREAVMVAARAVALATSVMVTVGASAVVTGVLTVDRVETGLEMLEVVLVVQQHDHHSCLVHTRARMVAQNRVQGARCNVLNRILRCRNNSDQGSQMRRLHQRRSFLTSLLMLVRRGQ